MNAKFFTLHMLDLVVKRWARGRGHRQRGGRRWRVASPSIPGGAANTALMLVSAGGMGCDLRPPWACVNAVNPAPRTPGTCNRAWATARISVSGERALAGRARCRGAHGAAREWRTWAASGASCDRGGAFPPRMVRPRPWWFV